MKTLKKTVRPSNNESGRVAVSYSELESILKGDVGSIDVHDCRGVFRLNLKIDDEVKARMEPRANYVLVPFERA